MSEPFIGQIQIIGFNFPPRGWAFCDGQLIAISQNTALFSLLGTTFGGDGRATFGLPDLRGRIPKHARTGPGLSPVQWGQKGGAENQTITTDQMPAHTHTVNANSGQPDETDPENNYPATLTNGTEGYAETKDVKMKADMIDSVGGNRGFSIINPFLGLYFCIAIQGTYPSRS